MIHNDDKWRETNDGRAAGGNDGRIDPAGGFPLSCLLIYNYSININFHGDVVSVKKQVETCKKNCITILEKNVENALFITVTFPGDVGFLYPVVSRIYNSLASVWLRRQDGVPAFRRYELHESEALHVHALWIMPWSTGRDGFNFPAFFAANRAWKAGRRSEYRRLMRDVSPTVKPELKAFWKELRLAAKSRGAGWCQATPIYDPNGISRYVSEYMLKGLDIEKPGELRGFKMFSVARSLQVAKMSDPNPDSQFPGQCRVFTSNYGKTPKMAFGGYDGSKSWAFKFLRSGVAIPEEIRVPDEDKMLYEHDHEFYEVPEGVQFERGFRKAKIVNWREPQGVPF